MTLTRRGLLRGLGGLICAPAIVRVTSLMPIREFLLPEPLLYPSALTIDMITREAIELWRNSNLFIQRAELQYEEVFRLIEVKIPEFQT